MTGSQRDIYSEGRYILEVIMKKFIYILGVLFVTSFMAGDLYAQVDKREVRSGNRDYRDGNWREAEIDYRKALVKDSRQPLHGLPDAGGL